MSGSLTKDDRNSTVPPVSQAQVAPMVGAGHAPVQVLPPTAGGGNRPVATTASITGDTPVFAAYKHN